MDQLVGERDNAPGAAGPVDRGHIVLADEGTKKFWIGCREGFKIPGWDPTRTQFPFSPPSIWSNCS